MRTTCVSSQRGKHVTFRDTRSERSIDTAVARWSPYRNLEITALCCVAPIYPFPQLDTWNLLLAGVLETVFRFVLTKISAMPTEENCKGSGTSEMCRFHQ